MMFLRESRAPPSGSVPSQAARCRNPLGFRPGKDIFTGRVSSWGREGLPWVSRVGPSPGPLRAGAHLHGRSFGARGPGLLRLTSPDDVAGGPPSLNRTFVRGYGYPIPITLTVAPEPTVNPKRWVGGGAKSPFNAASTPHIAIVWGRTESVRGDEASPQSIVDIS